MRDYVLPDFSSIKKGFCKVSDLAYYEKIQQYTLSFTYTAFFFSLCCSLERRWILLANIRPGSRFCGSPMRGLQSQRCSFTPLTSAFRRWAYLRLWSTPLTICRKVDFIWLHLIICICGLKCNFIESTLIYAYFLCPEMQPHFYKNIVLTGGNTLFPGFRDRVYKEVRALAPVEYEVSVVLPQKYVLSVLKEKMTFCLVNIYWIFLLFSVLFATHGKEESYWPKTLTLKRWWSRETIMRKMDIMYVKRSLIFDLHMNELSFGTENLNTAHMFCMKTKLYIWLLYITLIITQ